VRVKNPPFLPAPTGSFKNSSTRTLGLVVTSFNEHAREFPEAAAALKARFVMPPALVRHA